MKVLTLWLFCAFTSARASSQEPGTSVAWPGGSKSTRQLSSSAPTATPAVTQAQTKTTAYSTTQYINAFPISGLTGFGGQFVYQPQISAFNPFQQSYYPIDGGSFFPGGASIFGDGAYYPGGGSLYPSGDSYFPGGGAFFPPGGSFIDGSYYPVGGGLYPGSPIAPISPIGPEQPSADDPSYPSEQPTGDADTTVVDSAEFPPEKQGEQTTAQENKPVDPQAPPANGFPSYPQPPQGTGTQVVQQPAQENGETASLPQNDQDNQSGQQPLFPQVPGIQQPFYPQYPFGNPGFPQYPSNLPQGSIPGFPQYPSNSQIPQGTIPGFPQYPSNQGTFPGFPQYPSNVENPQDISQFPQSPSPSPPTSFPSADNSNKRVDDEDTIAVDSA